MKAGCSFGLANRQICQIPVAQSTYLANFNHIRQIQDYLSSLQDFPCKVVDLYKFGESSESFTRVHLGNVKALFYLPKAAMMLLCKTHQGAIVCNWQSWHYFCGLNSDSSISANTVARKSPGYRYPSPAPNSPITNLDLGIMLKSCPQPSLFHPSGYSQQNLSSQLSQTNGNN